jgi:hypothetical protein
MYVLFMPTLRPRFPLLVLAFVAAATTFSHAAPPLFPPDHPLNQRISAAPVAAASAAIITNIGPATNRIHADFGQDNRTGADLYGIPYNVVHSTTAPITPMVSVVIDAYPGESDIVPAPIPTNAVIEGDFQNGPRLGLASRGDSHLIVWDWDTSTVYEYYACSRPSENADGRWHADQQTVWHANTNAFRTLGWTSADAAGLPILPCLLRPDEALPVAQGGTGIITHAVRVTFQNSKILNKYIYPASHVANPGNNNPAIQPPMGARLRLKASTDISLFNAQSKVIAQAMKDYGVIIADNGSNYYFSGASYSPNSTNQFALTFSDADILDSIRGLQSLHYGDFEVVDLTPIITSISPTTAPTGSTITFTGLNFSGAAGHLQVLFGSTLATSISIIDDAHITATIPAGSGAVDVRVRSGTPVTPDTQNFTSPTFGYGLSAITTAARFTYGAATTIPCCRGATCALIPAANCTDPAGTAGAYLASGSACNSAASSTTPCCHADYNKLDGITLQDIFDFLNDWFAGSQYAAAGATSPTAPLTVQNIFNFLNYWFAGC